MMINIIIIMMMMMMTMMTMKMMMIIFHCHTVDHYDDEEYDDWQPLFPRKPSHELWGKRWRKDSNTFRQLNKERFGTCLEELAGFEALPHIPLQMITVSADKCGQDYCNLRVKQKYQHI